MPSPRLLLLLSLILFAGFSRLLPHTDNFAPLTALTLFAAAILSDRRWAMGLPLAAQILSDLALQNTKYIAWPGYFLEEFPFVCGALMMTAIIGFTLRNQIRPGRVILAALASSGSFFLITNFGSWLIMSTTYSRSLAGLMDCYVKGIPFYRSTFESDLIFTAAFFGGFALLERFVPQFRNDSLGQPSSVAS